MAINREKKQGNKKRILAKRSGEKWENEWKTLRENPLYSLNAFKVMHLLLSSAAAVVWFQFDLCFLEDIQLNARTFIINLHTIHFIHTLKSYTTNTVNQRLLYSVNNTEEIWRSDAMRCTEYALDSMNCNDKFQLNIGSCIITFTWIFYVSSVVRDATVSEEAKPKMFAILRWDVENNRNEN